MNDKHWTVEIDLSEQGDLTTAHAMLAAPGSAPMHGYGEAHRNPVDPPAARIGDELAVARALTALTDKLHGVASTDVKHNVGQMSAM
ncbi:dsRBD fold-containing protein [Nonomuraea typhae]|uniref:DsRBD fold-containing protein n=1 Tax=Nonomuraea typhae TaxID=2603600 RepID=A0ABW7Z9N2_9ACTN